MRGGFSVGARRRLIALVVFSLVASVFAVAQVATAPFAKADPTSYDGWVLDDDPLGYWRLDETSGTEAVDAISSNQTPGTYTDATLGTPGLVNRGVDVGADSGTSIAFTTGELGTGVEAGGTALEIADEFSFEFWANGTINMTPDASALPAHFGPVSFHKSIGTGCDVVLEIDDLVGPDQWIDGGCNEVFGVSPASTRHVVFAADQTAGNLYIDGRLVGSVPSTDFVTTNTTWQIAYDGRVDNVAVYDTALTATQVNNHFWATPHAAKKRTFGLSVPYVAYDADPVNMASGGASHAKSLLTYPEFAYGMDLSATYNHLDTTNNALGMGPGWTTSLDSSITALGDGSLLWRGPDGRQVRVLSAGTNSWPGPEGTLSTIRKDSGSTPAHTYVLQFFSGERWEYDSAGRLARRCEGVGDWSTRTDWTTSGSTWTSSSDWCGTSGTGDYVTVAWTESDDTQPETVTASNGMLQRFTYDSGRVSLIRAEDDATEANDRLVRFGYTTSEPSTLEWVSAPHFATEIGSSVVAPVYPFELYTIEDGVITEVARTAGQHVTGVDVPAPSTAMRIVANTYDETTGRVVTQKSQIGAVTTYSYNDTTNAVTASTPDDAGTQSTTYQNDSYGRVTSITDTTSNQVTKTWGQGTVPQVPSATPTEQTDRTGAKVGAFYDSVGRLVERVKPDAQTGFVPGAYNDATPTVCQRLPGASFPAPDTTTVFTRPAGAGSATMDCSGKRFGVESFTYLNAADTRVDTHTDAAGQKTKFTYSGTSKSPSTVTTGCQIYVSSVCSSGESTAPAVTTTYTYADNKVTSVTDGTGVKNCTAYNGVGQVSFTTPGVSGSCPSSSTSTSTVYTYTALGMVATIDKPSPQGTWTYTYYGTGQPKAVADPLGNDPVLYTYSYLVGGHEESVTDEAGETTTTTSIYGITNTTTCGGGISGSDGEDPDGDPVRTPCQTVTVTAPAPAATTTQVFDANGQLRLTATPASSTLGSPRSWNIYEDLGRLSKSYVSNFFIDDEIGYRYTVTKYTYDDNGRVTDTQSGTETGTAGEDATASTTYDFRGRVLTRTSAKNDATKVTTKYAYDQNDRVIQEVGAAPNGTFPTQNSDGTYPAPTSSGNDWTFKATTYAPTGSVKQTGLYRNDSPAGPGTQATVANTYDAAGKQTCVDTRSVAAATGYTETHTYQATDYNTVNGYVFRTRIPIGAVSGCSDHFSSGYPEVAYWAVTQNNYNNDGSLNWQQNPVQYAAHTTVDSDHVYYRTTYGYDAAGRQTSVQTPDPSSPGTATVTSSTCYTDRGEVRAKVSPNGAGVSVVRYDYFAQKGVVHFVADPLAGYNATTGCASEDPATECTDEPLSSPLVGVTEFCYDGRGNREKRRTQHDDGSGDWLQEQWTFDLANRPTGYTSNDGTAEVAWTKTYDTRVRVPDGANFIWVDVHRPTFEMTFTGDTADGSLRRDRTRFAPSGSVVLAESALCGSSACPIPDEDDEDDLDCLELTTAATCTKINTTYDPLGRRATVADNSPGIDATSYTYAYNTAGNITQVTYPDGETLDTKWNLSGQPYDQVYPDGTHYRYRYDTRLELQYADVYYAGSPLNLAAYTLNANGQRTAETLTGASSSSRTWTRNGSTGTADKYTQVLAGTTSITTPITYDNAGRVATDCKGTGSGGACQSSDVKTTYAYDAASQLLSATVTNDSTSGHIVGWAYTYGNHGNRLSQTVTKNGTTPNAVTNYTWDSTTNQFMTAASSSTGGDNATYSYDAAGRQTGVTRSGGLTQTFTYNPRGLESEIDTNSGTSVQYRDYDPLGQWNCFSADDEGCQERDPETDNSFFYWDVSGRGLPQILQWVGAGTNYRYLYGGERITLWGYYFSNDYLGSTLAGPADANAPTGYSPFGEPIDGVNTAGFRYRSEMYANHQLYLRARNYQPSTGLLTSRDPLDGVDGTPTVANPHAYVQNSPLNGSDPSGEMCTDPVCFNLASYPQSIDVPVCHPSPGWPPIKCPEITLPIPDIPDIDIPTPDDVANFGIDRLEQVGRIAAKVDFALTGSPSPASDRAGLKLAVEQIKRFPEGGGTRLWECREGGRGSAPVRSSKYGLKVWCVAPAFLLPPKADGLTIGHFVFCRDEAGCRMDSPSKLLEHELWHVDQFETFGDLFGAAYALESARVAASGNEASGCMNRYERPAYQATGRC